MLDSPHPRQEHVIFIGLFFETGKLVRLLVDDSVLFEICCTRLQALPFAVEQVFMAEIHYAGVEATIQDEVIHFMWHLLRLCQHFVNQGKV